MAKDELLTELVSQLRDVWSRESPTSRENTEEDRLFFTNELIEQLVVHVGVESTHFPKKAG